MPRPLTAGLSCAVCGTHVDIATPFSWQCPSATALDRHHAGLRPQQRGSPARGGASRSWRSAFLAWDSFAAANGMTEFARRARR